MRWLTIISFAFIFIFIQPVSAALKKCVDDKGRTQYYDNTPPPECLGKATVEMSDHGVVIKKTKEEVELKEAEEQAKREFSRNVGFAPRSSTGSGASGLSFILF